MPRSLRDAALGTREARLRLKVHDKPYWRLIEPGLHLGYRRLKGRSGSWCQRRYLGRNAYVVESLGAVADDYAEADGETVLDFKQAQRRVLASKPKAPSTITVADAIEAYLTHLEDSGRDP